MIRLSLLLLVILLMAVQGYGQNGNFRSIASGPWTTVGIWERDADGNGTYEDSPSALTPTALDGLIFIQNSHNVRINTNLSVDQVTVLAGGRISVLATGTLTVLNGAGVDLLNQGLIVTPAAQRLVFTNGAEYQHAIDGGNIPLATWNSGSQCAVTGVTNTVPGNLNQPNGFGNFVWNCPGQNTVLFLNGALTNVAGDFSILNTNGFRLFLASSIAPTVISIGGNFIVSGNSRFIGTGTTSLTVNVGGNFVYQSTNAASSSLVSSSGSSTFSVQGDVSVNTISGVMSLSDGAGNGTMNIGGDFVLTNGTFTELSSGSGTVNFTGAGSQNFTNTGTIHNSATIDYYIAPAKTIVTTGESPIKGRSLVVDGTLSVQSLNSTGAIANGTSAGNVRTTNRVYNNGATIMYSGSGPQFIGVGHPTGNVNLVVNNPAGVSFTPGTAGNFNSSTLSIGGQLELANGDLSIQGSVTIPRTLRLTNPVIANGNQINIIGNYVSLLIDGAGDFGQFPFATGVEQIRDLDVNIPGGNIEFTNELAILGNASVDAGAVVCSSPEGITISGNLSIDGSLTTNEIVLNGNLLNNGVLNHGSVITFAGSNLQTISGSSVTIFNNMVIENTTQPVSVSIESNQSIAGALSLAAGARFDPDGTNDLAIFTMLSSGVEEGQTAMIAPLPGDAVISGNITVQRYIPAGDNLSRYISTPVSNSPVSQLQDDFAVTGNFTGTSYPCTGCTQTGASLKYYREPVSGDFNTGLMATPVSGGNNGELLVPGRGYSAYMWNGVDGFVWDVRGTINRGRIEFNVTHTPSTPSPIVSADGWNLIGNPYPSAISWDNEAGWERSEIGSTVYVWDAVGGHWRTYDYTLAEQNQDLPSGIIPLGQAFWVYKYPGTAVMAVNEAAKSNSTGSFYRKRNPENQRSLTIALAQGSAVDKAFVLTGPEATLNAPKLELGIEHLSVGILGAQNKKFVYSSIPSAELSDIELSITANPGTFDLRFDVQGDGNDFQGYYLVDRYLNRAAGILDPYSFVISKNEQTSKGRFVLTKSPQNFIKEGTSEEQVTVSVYPNPTSGLVSVDVNSAKVRRMILQDVTGRTFADVPFHIGDFATGEIDMRHFNAGIYIIRVVMTDGQKVVDTKLAKY